MNSKQSLEQRIAAALGNEALAAADLMTLVTEVEAVIATTDTAVHQARDRALDPKVVDHDARTLAQDAEHTGKRLQAALQQLRVRVEQAQVAEYRITWKADCAEVKARRDALAAEFSEIYQKATAQLVDLFERVKAFDKEIKRTNDAALNSDAGDRLLGVELTARGLNNFMADTPSILVVIKLPNFECSSRMAWPLPETPIGVQVAASIGYPRHPAGDWHRVLAARDAQRQREAAKMAAHHASMAKQREERENAEAREGNRRAG